MEGDEIEATDEETKLVVKVRFLRFTMYHLFLTMNC